MKRFYREARVERTGARFAVVLDAQPIKTPARRVLEVWTNALAQMIADEWNAQGDELDMASMPCTALAYAAIDRVKAHREEVLEETTGFANADLLCYRAQAPQELVERQQTMWEPFLAWAEERYSISFTRVEGIVHTDQPDATLAAIQKAVEACDNMKLAALNSATNLTGSLVLALALLGGHATAEEAWAAAQLDADFQAETWGEDGEAVQVADSKYQALDAAARFLAAA